MCAQWFTYRKLQQYPIIFHHTSCTMVHLCRPFVLLDSAAPTNLWFSPQRTAYSIWLHVMKWKQKFSYDSVNKICRKDMRGKHCETNKKNYHCIDFSNWTIRLAFIGEDNKVSFPVRCFITRILDFITILLDLYVTHYLKSIEI